MGAGQPNWQKLYELGKLPKEARGNVPMLAQLDILEKKIEQIKKGVCDDCRERLFKIELKKEDQKDSFVENCEVDGCKYTAFGKSEAVAKNNLRLHSRTHEVK